MTLKAPPLAAFGRSAAVGVPPVVPGPTARRAERPSRRITTGFPGAQVRWRYTHVANGLAVVLPRAEVARLAAMPGVARVWPNVRYHALRDAGGPQQIGADKLWGAEPRDGRQRDEDRDHRRRPARRSSVLQSDRLHLPARVPEGSDRTHDAEGDRAADVRTRHRRPTSTRTRRSTRRSRSTQRTSRASPPASRRLVDGQTISGVAPQAYLGNYKALTIPTPGLRARRKQRRDRRGDRCRSRQTA